MAYGTKEQEREKRKNQEGSYSVYNYMYKFLMDNYEPKQLDNLPSMALESLERKLLERGKEYCIKGGNKFDEKELAQYARNAITNFINNNDEVGYKSSYSFGRPQDNSFEVIRDTIKDLKW